MNLSAIQSGPLVILFNVEAIEVSITNVYDHEKHILLEQKAPSIFTVIKNKSRLLKLANTLENIISMANNTKQHNQLKPIIVSYSSKPSHSIKQKLSKISTLLAQSIIYFKLSPNNHSNIRPNRAFVSFNQQENIHEIIYGEGYSQTKTKQELRLAVECIFGLNGCNDRVWIIETQKGLKDEQKELTKSGYKHLWTLQNFDIDQNEHKSLQSAIKFCFQSSQEKIKCLQLPQNTNFPSSYYLHKLSTSIKPQEFKQITSKLETSHSPLTEVLSPKKILSDFLKYPKKSFTPTPKSSIRSQDSKQVCSLIFKNMADQKLYVNKSSVPKDIGGLYSEELIENRCFMTMMPNLFDSLHQQGFYSIPLDKSYFMMKNSLLKQYQIKKACALVKPYLEGIATLDKFGDEFLGLITSQKYHFQGLGSMLFWSLVSNQSFQIKTLLEQLTILKVPERKDNENLKQDQLQDKQAQYLTLYAKDLASFLQSSNKKNIRLLRTDYFQPFSLQKNLKLQTSFTESDITVEFTRKHKIKLKDLNINYLKEMYKLALILSGTFGVDQSDDISLGQRLLRGLGNHYKWEFDRNQLIDSLVKRAKILLKSLVRILQNSENEQPLPYSSASYQFIHDISLKYPLSLLLLLPRDYARFIKPSNPQENPFYDMLPKSEQSLENRYVVALLQKTHSFQIHGNSPPVFSLPNWIRSLGHKYRFIEYMSMLTHTKEEFILMSKKLKIMATNEKMNALLIVDHCQLCEAILDQAKNVRTVFVTKFKKGQHEMQVILDEDSEGRQEMYLTDSNDQLISLLIEVYERQIQKNQNNFDEKQSKSEQSQTMVQSGYLYKKYKFVLQTYVKIKSQLYNFQFQSVLSFMKSLHKNISQSKNRYKEILQRYKKNNEWKYIYALPLQKNNQKMTFTKNLQGFIDVMKFVQLIRGQKIKQEQMMRGMSELGCDVDMFKIDQKSVQYIREWTKYIEEDIKEQIIEVLENYIYPLQKYPLNEYLRTQMHKDHFMLIIEVMKVILKDNQSQMYKLFPNQECLDHFQDQVVINLQQLPTVRVNEQDKKQQDGFYMVHTNHKVAVYNDINGQKVMQIQGNFKDVKGWVQINNNSYLSQQNRSVKLIAENEKQKKLFDHSPIKEVQIKTQNIKQYFQFVLQVKHQNLIQLTITNLFAQMNSQKTSIPQTKTLKFNNSQLTFKQILTTQIVSLNLNPSTINHQKQKQKVFENLSGFIVLLILTKREVFLSKIDINVKSDEIQVIRTDDLDCHKLINLQEVQQQQSIFKNVKNYIKKASFVSIKYHNKSLLDNSKYQNRVEDSFDVFPPSSPFIIITQTNLGKSILTARIIKPSGSYTSTTQSPLIFSHQILNIPEIELGLLIHNNSFDKQTFTHQTKNTELRINSPLVLVLNVDTTLFQNNPTSQQHIKGTFIKCKIIDIMNLIQQKAQLKSKTNIYLHTLHHHNPLTNQKNSLILYYTIVDTQQPLQKIFTTNLSYFNSLTINLNPNSIPSTQFGNHFLSSLPSLRSTYFLPLYSSNSSFITLTDNFFEQRKYRSELSAPLNLLDRKYQCQESFVRLWKMK